MTKVLTARVTGPFRVTGPDGADLTPTSVKSQGLLLLLLDRPDGMRGRAFLQDKLWSDRGQEQAAASLRQALTAIRKALGPHADILSSNRRSVTLDVGRILLDDADDADFAEGLDIRDPEFDAWLAAARSNRQSLRPPSGPAAPPQVQALNGGPVTRDRVALVCHSDGTEMCDWTAQVLADSLFLGLSESAHVEVFRGGPGATPAEGPFHLVLHLNCLRSSSDRIAIRLAAMTGLRNRQIWSGYSSATLHGGPPIDNLDVLSLVNSAVEAVAVDRKATEPDTPSDRADALLREAVGLIFTMRPDRVMQADRLLEEANSIRPSPLYLAWRLQIRTIQRLERHGNDESQLRDEGRVLAAQALEGGADNSMVLALLANANLFLFRDPGASLHFGTLSMNRNAHNPMAAWALSSARLYTGDAKGAYADAVRGRQIAMQSRRRFFWDLQQAATAMILGRTEETVSLLESITLECPDFRPPLRYLLALKASQGEDESAVEYGRRLTQFEPDFSVDRLVMDVDYPASLIHRTGLIDLRRVRSIS